ncbi:hypothetical protein KCP78_16520 [Salmonella enterica subsp. enterica]|nr:hypothetical protein KCP78_16520 [Salmonella enterica subsp. enterica]
MPRRHFLMALRLSGTGGTHHRPDKADDYAVPPTVRLSTFSVSWPTPTTANF